MQSGKDCNANPLIKFIEALRTVYFGHADWPLLGGDWHRITVDGDMCLNPVPSRLGDAQD